MIGARTRLFHVIVGLGLGAAAIACGGASALGTAFDGGGEDASEDASDDARASGDAADAQATGDGGPFFAPDAAATADTSVALPDSWVGVPIR